MFVDVEEVVAAVVGQLLDSSADGHRENICHVNQLESLFVHVNPTKVDQDWSKVW